MSSYNITTEERDILKQGLQHSIPPNYLNKTDIFASFELIHRFLKEDLKNNEEAGRTKSELSYLANSYYYNYHPTKQTLKKHGVLKRLKNKKDIIILKPDKGNSVVVLDRGVYNSCILKIIDDKTKFKKLNGDITMLLYFLPISRIRLWFLTSSQSASHNNDSRKQ